MKTKIDKKRKVIQMCISPKTDDFFEAVYALCDDGTLWVLIVKPDSVWEQFQEIPQT